MIRQRCAIYTRKSTEEGLDQAFNSLDAQREACEAYVISQRAEGWDLLPDAYDDGGWSGGTLERPGLLRLLEGVRTKQVDVIVVYKVDRLTRSLADFAKIVEILDGAGASFVSITQAFNTTTSMGRLTLNVLLSFAQFEREVIAERVRDKIAASKAKGMWMGGRVSLGYDVVDRKLVPNEAEAATVRHIFERYLDVPSVHALKRLLDSEGIVTKRIVSKFGARGGQPFGRGGLFHMLSNPLFIGKTRHGDKIYDGLHDAIIPIALWDAVQRKLDVQSVDRSATGENQAFLTGLIHDEHRRPMSPTHATKKTRRYYYYASNSSGDVNAGKPESDCAPAVRISQKVIHEAVRHALAELFSSRSVVDLLAENDTDMTTLQCALERSTDIRASVAGTRHAAAAKLLRDLRAEFVVSNTGVAASIDLQEVIGILLGQKCNGAAVCDRMSLELPIIADNCSEAPRLRLDGRVRRRAGPEPRLLRLLINGHIAWRRAFLPGGARLSAHQVRLARLATLAPDITAAILEGRQPASLTSRVLLRLPELPYDWAEQRQLLGFGTDIDLRIPYDASSDTFLLSARHGSSDKLAGPRTIG